MGWSPPKPCARPGCGALVQSGRWCPAHKPAPRPTAPKPYDAEKRRPYKTAAWLRFRKWYLTQHPVCEVPGCGQPANEVDHIVPLDDGGAHLSTSNSQALCKPCHSRKTARQDGGFGRRKGRG